MFSKILIIDDSKFQRSFVKKTLGETYEVFDASNGEDGLMMLRQKSPDLVILDNMLVNELGYDICRKIRTYPEYKHLPVIMVSSRDNPADINQGFESGVNAYLAKSSDANELIKMIRSFEDKGIKVRNEKVLIIDDSPMIRAIISRALKALGFQIFTAENGEEGIELALKNKPDVITCDVEMPGIDGYETTEKLKASETTRDIPIIMVTTKDDNEEMAKGYACGVTEYFPKPFQPERLASYIEQMLKSRLEKHEETILIVEDSRMELNMLTNIVKFEGYEVITATDGEEALEIINNSLQKIDLVLCDVFMPKLDGVRLLEILNAEGNKRRIPPFIFVSVADKHSVAIDCLRLGAVDFITKPFDAIELKLRINNHIKLQKLIDLSKVVNE